MENENDYGKSRNDAIKVTDDIQFKMRLEDAKRQELSPVETAGKLMEGVDIQSLGKMIKIIAVLRAFYDFVPGMKENYAEWKSCMGYAYAIRGYTEHPEALEFDKFVQESNTLKDVLNRILSFEKISLDVYLTYVPRLDRTWFLNHINTETIMDFLVLAFNEAEQASANAISLAEIEKSNAKVEESERLHKILMTD